MRGAGWPRYLPEYREVPAKGPAGSSSTYGLQPGGFLQPKSRYRPIRGPLRLRCRDTSSPTFLVMPPLTRIGRRAYVSKWVKGRGSNPLATPGGKVATASRHTEGPRQGSHRLMRRCVRVPAFFLLCASRPDVTLIGFCGGGLDWLPRHITWSGGPGATPRPGPRRGCWPIGFYPDAVAEKNHRHRWS